MATTATPSWCASAVDFNSNIADVNLDGNVLYVGNLNDRDPILVNIGGSVPTSTRVQQLP